MPDTYKRKLNDDYFESIYKHVNILTPEQFDLASNSFARDYQKIMPTNKEVSILDVGCGVGHFLYYLKKNGYRNYYGIDVSPQQVEYCTKYITDKVEVADAEIFLAQMAEQYDLIVAHDVVEHIPKDDVLSLLNLVFHALKKGGVFIMRVPNMSNPFGLDARYNDFTHELGFTAKSVYQVLWISGFREIEILPSRQIILRNYRNFIRKWLVKALHQLIRFCYYIQDYTVPQILDNNLIAVGRKI
jgi:2-polyprenyl-3-methyl-5-hydroxy-6-metoxy-1,4-benzoquinol methylase